MKTEDLIKYMLPKEMTEYFDLVEVKERNDVLTIILEEKNNPPEEHKEKPLESKGFLPSVKIQDFPIREWQVYLEVRRRVWRDKSTGKTYSKNWELTAKGTSYTKEFGLFLKEMVR